MRVELLNLQTPQFRTEGDWCIHSAFVKHLHHKWWCIVRSAKTLIHGYFAHAAGTKTHIILMLPLSTVLDHKDLGYNMYYAIRLPHIMLFIIKGL